MFPRRSSITLNITKKIICSHTVGPSGKPGKKWEFLGNFNKFEKILEYYTKLVLSNYLGICV